MKVTLNSSKRGFWVLKLNTAYGIATVLGYMVKYNDSKILIDF